MDWVLDKLDKMNQIEKNKFVEDIFPDSDYPELDFREKIIKLSPGNAGNRDWQATFTQKPA